MRAAIIGLFSVCMISFLTPLAARAGGPSCGCEQRTCGVCSAPAAGCGCRGLAWCGRHCGYCCHCDRDREAPREARAASRAAAIPTGPVVESFPMMRAMPAMFAMPMMPMMPMAVGQTQATRAAPEPTCAGSQDRLDELDARVEALNLRMKTIQRAVEIQTVILEELKAKGSIGGQKLPD